MAGTKLGTIKTLIPGAQIQVGRTSVTYTLPKSMPTADALDPTQHPALGSILVILGNAVALNSITIANEEGGMSTVNYDYVGSTEQPETPATPPDVMGNFKRENATPPRFELDVTSEAISILRAPYFAGISEADKTVLAAMIQNGPIDSDGNQISRFLSGDARATEASTFIKEGIVSFNASSLVWKEVSYNQKWSSVPKEVGFIFPPPGPVPDIDGNWILHGLSASGFEDQAETVTRTYLSSLPGETWPTELYE